MRLVEAPEGGSQELAFGVAILGGTFLLIALLVSVRPLDKIGIVDDSGDVDLERVSAFAERSNAA